MALYNKDSRLSEVILSHPEAIPVMNRLGVFLGVGDSGIGSICSDRGIDPVFFLSVINTFIDKDYFPANPRNTFTLGKTVDYLEKTSAFYTDVQLPNIERHFNILLSRSGSENNLGLLYGFFNEIKARITECARQDSETLFPCLRQGKVPANVDAGNGRHDEVEERLHDLLYFFVTHLQGAYDLNLCTAVVNAVFALDKDYCQNNRIRTRILYPVMREMLSSKAD